MHFTTNKEYKRYDKVSDRLLLFGDTSQYRTAGDLIRAYNTYKPGAEIMESAVLTSDSSFILDDGMLFYIPDYTKDSIFEAKLHAERPELNRPVIFDSIMRTTFHERNALDAMLKHPYLPDALVYRFSDSEHRKLTAEYTGDRLKLICNSDLFPTVIEEYEITGEYQPVYKLLNSTRDMNNRKRGLPTFYNPAYLNESNAVPLLEGKEVKYSSVNAPYDQLYIGAMVFRRDVCAIDSMTTPYIDGMVEVHYNGDVIGRYAPLVDESFFESQEDYEEFKRLGKTTR